MSDIKAFLFDDDRGVSPVIGVILMVAITVILAAVIAAFVLGLGDTNSSTPSVTWDYDYDQTANEIEVTMTGGESFDEARVSFDGFPGSNTASPPVENLTADQTFADYTSGVGDGDTVSAGDTAVIQLAEDSTSGNDPDSSDFELDIIFESEDGGTSSTIGGTTGPDA